MKWYCHMSAITVGNLSNCLCWLESSAAENWWFKYELSPTEISEPVLTIHLDIKSLLPQIATTIPDEQKKINACAHTLTQTHWIVALVYNKRSLGPSIACRWKLLSTLFWFFRLRWEVEVQPGVGGGVLQAFCKQQVIAGGIMHEDACVVQGENSNINMTIQSAQRWVLGIDGRRLF